MWHYCIFRDESVSCCNQISLICEWIVQCDLWTQPTGSLETFGSFTNQTLLSRLIWVSVISSVRNNKEQYIFMKCRDKESAVPSRGPVLSAPEPVHYYPLQMQRPHPEEWNLAWTETLRTNTQIMTVGSSTDISNSDLETRDGESTPKESISQLWKALTESHAAVLQQVAEMIEHGLLILTADSTEVAQEPAAVGHHLWKRDFLKTEGHSFSENWNDWFLKLNSETITLVFTVKLLSSSFLHEALQKWNWLELTLMLNWVKLYVRDHKPWSEPVVRCW